MFDVEAAFWPVPCPERLLCDVTMCVNYPLVLLAFVCTYQQELNLILCVFLLVLVVNK